MIKLFTDAKSTTTMRCRTDHLMVIGKVAFRAPYKLRRAQNRKDVKRDMSTLMQQETKAAYQEAVNRRMRQESEQHPMLTATARHTYSLSVNFSLN